MSEDGRTVEQTDVVDEIRRVLADGMSFVRGRELSQSVSSFTFPELIDQAIKELSEDESDIRVSLLTTVRQIRQSVIDAVERALAMPASAFELRQGGDTANTTEDGEGASRELEDES